MEIVPPEWAPLEVLEMSGDRGVCPNDIALIDLSERGCSLVRCEGKRLHDLQIEIRNREVVDKREIFAVMLMRNQFIAREIDRSLCPGEVGVLFLGRIHNIENRMVDYLGSFGIDVAVQNECEYSTTSLNEFVSQLDLR